MEKKIGNNVSSGAEKVERVEKKVEAQDVDAAARKRNTQKSQNAAKKAKPAVKKSTKKALGKAEKKERTAAKVRVDKAKAKAAKKQEKALKKAEVKQRKIEKKAAIEQKKLRRKELIAQKRAERKQAKIDKRAALKEKKVERRAEKIARREMLKNETKAEKQKRIAREKKERIALKRQRQEAREKAREDKVKARRAAHARKASDKKHRREQRTERKANRRGFGGWLAAVISLGVACLALSTVVAYGAFEMNDMQVASENGYRATLYELVSVSEDMDSSLSKLRIASGASEQRKLLTDVLVDTALMESAIERIPVDQATSTDISSFVNRAGSYARRLLSKLAAGGELTAEEHNNVSALYEINAQLYSELNDIAMRMESDDFTAFLHGSESEVGQKFGEIGQNAHKGEEELSDAPFAGEGNVGENRLNALAEITSSEAKEKLAGYLSAYRLKTIEYTGETASPLMACYNFEMTDESGAQLFAQITKNGGKLAFFDTYEECTEKNFDLDTCDAIARDFLARLGIDNVEAVWLSDGGMIANLTYTSNESGVRAYPDLIRVRVCESKGRVVGIDARGYLVNYHERSYEAKLTESEAQERLSAYLTVNSASRALIPVDGREVLCYEFGCSYEGQQYLVYLDASTGEEVMVYRVRESARGSYLE